MADYIPPTRVFLDGSASGTYIDAADLNALINANIELNNAVIGMTQAGPGQGWQPAAQKADTSKMRLWVGYDNPGTDGTVVMGPNDPVILLT